MFAWLKNKFGGEPRDNPHTIDGKPLSPAAEKWLYGDCSQAVRDFIDGKTSTLTSADVDPEGTARHGAYEEAMRHKESGDTVAAQKVFFEQCSTPNIYKGHYRELFKIWRTYNKIDLKSGEFSNLIDRVQIMIRFDDEMITEMLTYWSEVQKRTLPANHFDKDRNLKITDAKALLSAAKAQGDKALIQKARALKERLS